MATKNQSFQIALQSPVAKRANDYYREISNHLHASDIVCTLDDHLKDNSPVLFLLDDDTPEEREQACLQEIIEQERRVIALYTGEKKLPFFKIWKLIGMGVEDVLSIRSQNQLGKVVQSKLERWFIIDRMLTSDRVNQTLVGSSSGWRTTLRQVIEMACFSSAPVLILGESGTGKELVAQLIHDLDPRRDKQSLVVLDCTTIVPELSGSEFFGHEKGAFTNAIANRDGAFTLADRGTLFLDEIGELPMRLQAELLRVSQEGRYKRVGSNIWKQAQFRLVCATNRELEQEIERGHFRQDLYYRLSTCIVRLPPLRERRLDVPELAAHFLAQILGNGKAPQFDPDVLNFLMTHPYPGNVRQLRQIITRIAYRHTGEGPITIGDIPDADRKSLTFSENHWKANGFKDSIRQAIADGVGLKDIKRITSDVAMDIAIEDAAGNLQEAARRLDVSDRLVQGYLAEKRG
ncbi:MAG: sigma-54-dependent transcriptional regulator [Saprospiraceae bacterium]